MARIAYIRVSTAAQNEARQIELLKHLEIDKTFLDKQSGTSTDRPQFQAMLSYVRDGDTVFVTEFSRLARNTQDLLRTVQQLQEKGVELVSLKEKMDTSTSTGKLMLTLFAALSEFERDLIAERTQQGREIAKANGKYKGRQSSPVDEKRFEQECKKWIAGEQTAVQTMRVLDMKAGRFYRQAKLRGFTK